MDALQWLETLGIDIANRSGEQIEVRSPINGKVIARVNADTPESVEREVQLAVQAFIKWRTIPAPRRGELIRLLGETLREHKEALSQLVTLECGKIIEEGRGEVQEMIDICDFAVGLSRQLYGLSMHSERPQHRMMEQWHPLGIVGIISAFNFPIELSPTLRLRSSH